jgi:hypothetical protein
MVEILLTHIVTFPPPSQVWAYVHVLKVRDRAAPRGRQVPAVPCAHRRGCPSLLHNVTDLTTETGVPARGEEWLIGIGDFGSDDKGCILE